jgi:hypothetical protein
MTFSVGDKVRWSSQAQGSVKKKVGVVAQVVPIKQMPDRSRFPHLYKNAGVGGYRDHESYVVVVGTRPYWPRANKLEKESAGQQSVDAKVADTYRQVAYAVEPVLAKLLLVWGDNNVAAQGMVEEITGAWVTLKAAMKYDSSVIRSKE